MVGFAVGPLSRRRRSMGGGDIAIWNAVMVYVVQAIALDGKSGKFTAEAATKRAALSQTELRDDYHRTRWQARRRTRRNRRRARQALRRRGRRALIRVTTMMGWWAPELRNRTTGNSLLKWRSHGEFRRRALVGRFREQLRHRRNGRNSSSSFHVSCVRMLRFYLSNGFLKVDLLVN